MNTEEFVNNLKRDKARGNLAPHQIILLIALSNIYSISKSDSTDINTLNSEFQKVWKEHKNLFISKNNKIGLPLKAFVNREYLQLITTDVINDFRNNLELETKVKSIKMYKATAQLFQDSDIKKYLITRIIK
ncbi:hypothetical protein ASF10_07055 [Flavobacterium sp. Leaf82]|uniref:hypothetical protein n=1 Tax=Flavobacterium sp. Leaf82 TaxID=1736238 RepID=UPI0006F50EB2|nr:hypothetical protein [Flavobacterium sp. Leaf82]KQO24926.1 hypothetical protein ASF10_07055 [Flavobacterium sp. Leaf82]